MFEFPEQGEGVKLDRYQVICLEFSIDKLTLDRTRHECETTAAVAQMCYADEPYQCLRNFAIRISDWTALQLRNSTYTLGCLCNLLPGRNTEIADIDPWIRESGKLEDRAVVEGIMIHGSKGLSVEIEFDGFVLDLIFKNASWEARADYFGESETDI